MANYYGVHNTTTPVTDTNPADYQWYQVAGGFGTTKSLYYTTSGGNSIYFDIATSQPNQYYQSVIDNTPILLASLASNIVVANSLSNSSVTTNAIAPSAVTGYNIAADTITGNLIQANTIQGSSIVAGSITATELAANVLTVGNIVSFGSTIEVPIGHGYWLDYTTGNTYFGGNTTIGNNLIVNGLITTGNLNSNTVITTTIVDNSVTYGVSIYTNTSQSITLSNSQVSTGTPPTFYTNSNVVMYVDDIPEPISVWASMNGTIQFTIPYSTSNNQFIITYYLSRFYANNVLAQSYTYQDPAFTTTYGSINYPFRSIFNINDYITSYVGNYTYTMGVTVHQDIVSANATVIADFTQASIMAQDFKR
jgi:hypothetical protein